eukprot:TRINITY_DN15724_c0_g1_i1.p1 TRINITY_DN15724_c0_g1~~TRINITY_DN15724_c0_g1_i1.p1  ORF type:complete len:702 (-),score=186.78 TRINITY_DN15724_c0_g1_i1:95-2200(-)
MEEEQKYNHPEPLKDLIRIGLKNDPISIKRIIRGKLTKEFVVHVFGVNAIGLVDSTGTILWPDEWVPKCLPTPQLYTILEKPAREHEEDAATDLYYEGQTALCLLNVPLLVDEHDLRAWLKAGIRAEDDVLMRAKAAVEDTKKSIKQLNLRKENIPFMTANEQQNPGQNIGKHRQNLMQMIDLELNIMTQKLKQAEAHYVQVNGEIRREYVSVERSDYLSTKHHNTWFAMFEGQSADLLSTIALEKEDWDMVRLSRSSYKFPRPYAVQGGLPDDRLAHEINMRGVLISRRRHGQGARVVKTHMGRELYFGNWVAGDKHGEGILLSKNGKYEGQFVHDVPQTKENEDSTFAFWNGDRYKGEFRTPGRTPSLLMPNKYQKGTFEGKGRIDFGDGSAYEGEFRNGKINGEGTFVCVNGKMEEGNFIDGRLHGGRGKRINIVGDVEEGNFYNGRLRDDGEVKKQTGEEFVGQFKFGRLHGVSKECTLLEGHKYLGEWKYGFRHGTGNLTFGPWRYEGQFLCGHPRSRGSVLRLSNYSASVTTTGRSKSKFPYLYFLAEEERKNLYKYLRFASTRYSKERKNEKEIEKKNLLWYKRKLKEANSALRDLRSSRREEEQRVMDEIAMYEDEEEVEPFEYEGEENDIELLQHRKNMVRRRQSLEMLDKVNKDDFAAHASLLSTVGRHLSPLERTQFRRKSALVVANLVK